MLMTLPYCSCPLTLNAYFQDSFKKKKLSSFSEFPLKRSGKVKVFTGSHNLSV